jgi:SAM-dependent methyltransferase
MQYLSQLDQNSDLTVEQFELPEEITLDRFLRSAAYVRTPAKVISKAIDILQKNDIDFGAFTFIDIGSGLGFVLAEASAYPFRKIIGIEISRFLHESCVRNIQLFDKSSCKCPDIESICADVMNFSFPESDMIVYTWEPLDPTTGKKFLTSINAFASQRDLKLVLISLGENYGAPSILRKIGGDSVALPGHELNGMEIAVYANSRV